MSAPSPARAQRAWPAERLAALPPRRSRWLPSPRWRRCCASRRLTVQSYWFDEAVTVELVRKPLGAMLSAIPGSESTPPLYYVLAWAVDAAVRHGRGGAAVALGADRHRHDPGRVLGGGATRDPTRGAGGGCPRCGEPAARVVLAGGARVRAAAAVDHLGAGDVRAHPGAVNRAPARGVGGAVRARAGGALLRALRDRAAGRLARVAVARAPEFRGTLAACAAVALAGAALLPLAIHQASNDRADFIRHIALGKRILQLPKQYLVGFDAPLEAAATVVAVALAAYGLWLLARRADARERRGAAVAARVAAPALLVPLVLAVVGADYLITRNLIAAWVPAMIVVAAGLGARRAGRAGVGAAVALCALSLAVLIAVEASPAYHRGDWRGVARALGPPPHAGRAVVISPFSGKTSLRIYTTDLGTPPPQPAGVGEIDVVAVAERRQGQTPKPPRPATLPPPPPGFTTPEVKRAETYTLVRYRAPSGFAPIDPALLAGLKLAPGVPAIGYQVPPQ